jgi:antitoxin (DNA-binding transcriptional repressor) of toxin-antitoxin stability system
MPTPARQKLTDHWVWTLLIYNMKTLSVKELRNSLSKLEAWLAEGEEIRIEKRGQPIGVLTAWRPDVLTQPEKPDFLARRRAIWGSRFFTASEVAMMRADELEAEEG